MNQDTQSDTQAEPMTAAAQLDELARIVESNTERIKLIADERDRLRTAMNAATAMNGVHERTIARLRGQLEQAKLAPGPTGLARVWSGYDDNEHYFPLFANLADAKAYAEAEYRAHCTDWGNPDPGELAWKEREVRTEDRGYPGMYDLESEEFGADGWVVCEMLVHASLASALAERPIEAPEEPEPEPQIPGQGALPVEIPRGFRIGDLVEITGRGAEHDGHIAEGQIGYVAEIDDNPEYPLGLAVEGFVGPVWCNSGEIRHRGACPSCRGTGSHREPDPLDGEFESDHACMDCDGTGRVAVEAESGSTR